MTAVEDLLRGSHKIASKVEVLRGGIVEVELVVTGGQVVADSTASTRRRCNLTLADPTGEVTPENASSLLTPFGTEIRIHRGLWVDGVETLWPQGVFRFDEVRITRDRELSIAGYDRSERVSANPWLTPYIVTEGTVVSAAIQDLITDRDSTASYGDWHSTAETTPGLALDGDPWQEARELARSIGCDLYLDPLGRYALTEVPDPDSDPVVWHFLEGEDNIALDLNREMSARTVDGDRVPSRVAVWADSSALLEPLLAVAVDDDPTSPTYYLGPYGTVTRQITSTVVTASTQAQTQADAELRRHKGGTEVVDITCSPHPGLDVGDVIEALESQTKTDSRYVLDRTTLPLTHDGDQSLQTRRRRL